MRLARFYVSGGVRMRTARGSVILAAGFSLVLVIAHVRVQGQGETFELMHKLAKGESLTYAYESSFSSVAQILIGTEQLRIPEDRNTTGQHTIEATAVSEDGVISLKIVRRLEVTSEGRKLSLPSFPEEIRIRPSGEILKSGGSPDYFLLRLPERAVAVNGSWMDEHALLVDAGVFGLLSSKLTVTFTLMSIERVGEHRVARIRVSGEGPFNFVIPFMVGASSVRIQVQGTNRLAGEVQWLVDQGRLQRSTQEASADMPLRMRIEGQTFTGRFVYRFVEQFDAVPGKN